MNDMHDPDPIRDEGDLPNGNVKPIAGTLHALHGDGTPDPAAEAAREMSEVFGPLMKQMVGTAQAENYAQTERAVWLAHASQAAEHLLQRARPETAEDLAPLADLSGAFGDAMVDRFRKRFAK